MKRNSDVGTVGIAGGNRTGLLPITNRLELEATRTVDPLLNGSGNYIGCSEGKTV